MTQTDSRVTIHMAASLDGFIARKDGSVDWLETSDEFAGGATMDPEFVVAFLKTIDCYVMGSRTYETALGFEAKGLGWAYGDKPTFVLTHRDLPRTRDTVEFHSGDLAQFVNERLRPRFRNIWCVGGGVVSGECLRLGLADEVRYSILPIVIGDGIPFFEKLGRDIALHLAEVKAYQSGIVDLRYEVRGRATAPAVSESAMPATAQLQISVMLAVPSAPQASAWYCRALGAEELWNLGSVIGLTIAGAPFFLGEPASNGWDTPERLGMPSARIEIFCDNPDAFIAGAVAAGATAKADPVRVHAMPWGPHRQGSFTDPFGHRWLVGDRSPLSRHPA